MQAKPAIQPWRLRHAAQVVQQGGVIAYPTESVYGLGCDPLNPQAVKRLLQLKQRNEAQGLILISDRFERLLPFVGEIPALRLVEIEATWPGPVTWVMPAAARVPGWLRGRHDSLAVRVTAHPIAAALCAAAGMCLVSTSANLHRHPPARTALQVRACFGDGVDLIVPGKTGGMARPTPIHDALSGSVLRR